MFKASSSNGKPRANSPIWWFSPIFNFEISMGLVFFLDVNHLILYGFCCFLIRFLNLKWQVQWEGDGLNMNVVNFSSYFQKKIINLKQVLIGFLNLKWQVQTHLIVVLQLYEGVGSSDVRIFGPKALPCSICTPHPLESHIEGKLPHLLPYKL